MDNYLARGKSITLRTIQPADLAQIAPHEYSVSIDEPLTDLSRLEEVHSQTGLWERDAGAVAIIDTSQDRLVGTCQFFRSGPCIHGLEIGYIVHDVADRGRGYASEALSLLSTYLFETRLDIHRLQLTIDVSNEASFRVAEKGDYLREGVLRRGGFPPDHPDCFVYSRTRDGDL